jgi:predicted P-loop ATPase
LADVDIQQLWAEVHELFQSREQHWLTSEEMEMLNAENEDHLIVSPIQEMVAEKFPWGEEGTGFVWMSTVTIGEEIELQHVNTADARAIVSAVRALNRRHYGCEGIDPVEKKVRGIKRFRVPQRRDDDWPDDPVGLPLPPAPGVVGVDRPDLRSSSCA